MKTNNNPQYLTEKLLLINKSFNTYVLDFKKTDPHYHAFYEIFYILSGSLLHFINGKKEVLKAGDIVIIRPDIDVHFFKPIKQNMSSHRDILINKDLFKKICNYLSPEILRHINNSDFPLYNTLLNEQLSFYEKNFSMITANTYYSKELSPRELSLLTLLISEITQDKILQSSSRYKWIDSLLNILNTVQHFKIPLSELLSTHFYYDQSYMCKTFKKVTGMTMSQYFNKVKLDYAKTLLLSTDYTVYKIADLSGFNTIAHFYHMFKQEFNCTPIDFRNSAN